ncbi:hypothetical protein NC653_038714 [Populus alba x Populus x berolinensis]|uniref:Uncharacterized protein n=1 Tax=Populus alba x Populus x berolinensis TaxID=444605 RepID=A0AAD6PV87_9ROSI|nr:hypothetical protein NC653_038714 [Populus alba x Populus x berolinensis]
MYVKAKPTTDVNRNTEWFTYPGVWTTYMLIVFMSWLLVLSIFGCSPGMAWTIVHFCHFAQNEGLGNYFRQGSRDRKPTARVLNSKVSSVKERTPYDSPAFDLRRRPQGRAVTSDHQPICFPYSRFLILGISLSEVRDTVAVLNAQKSISKNAVFR